MIWVCLCVAEAVLIVLLWTWVYILLNQKMVPYSKWRDANRSIFILRITLRVIKEYLGPLAENRGPQREEVLMEMIDNALERTE